MSKYIVESLNYSREYLKFTMKLNGHDVRCRFDIYFSSSNRISIDDNADITPISLEHIIETILEYTNVNISKHYIFDDTRWSHFLCSEESKKFNVHQYFVEELCEDEYAVFINNLSPIQGVIHEFTYDIDPHSTVCKLCFNLITSKYFITIDLCFSDWHVYSGPENKLKINGGLFIISSLKEMMETIHNMTGINIDSHSCIIDGNEKNEWLKFLKSDDVGVFR